MSEMTIEAAKQKLINWCRSQIGYHEVGDNNTKYADADYDTRLYGFDMHGQPWCDYFVDYAFIINFGYALGTAMTYQNPNGSAACAVSASYYKQHGAFFHEPEIGDQIFFYSGGGINHTGIVEDVSGSSVITIEGNSSDSVKRNTYNIKNPNIAGYGRPIWNLVDNVDIEELNEASEEENVLTKTEVRTMQGKYPLLTIVLKNEQREDVKALQCLLKLRGNDSIDVDGFYGKETESAVMEYQSKVGLLSDGECGKDTWYSLITG